VQFEWEDESPSREGCVSLASPAQEGDPVRVTGACVEVESRIGYRDVASVRGHRLFYSGPRRQESTLRPICLSKHAL